MIARRLDADVVVVGAGPAGAATALLLARAGVDVLLVDRQRFPRAKPCGDCLSPEASRVLDRLGALPDVLAAAPALLEGWRIVAPDGSAFEQRFDTVCGDEPLVATAIAIERSRLDAILLEHAQRAGARFIAPVQVTDLSPVTRGTRTLSARAPFPLARATVTPAARLIRSRLVIGADGLRSVIARRIGAVRPPGRLKLSLTGHLTSVAGVATLGEMHAGDGFCAGVAPVTRKGNVCNLTLVAEANRFGREAARDPRRFYRTMLEHLPALRGRLPEIHSNTVGSEHPLLASGPFDRPTRHIVADGVVLIGDAAGYFDPFTGQGIYQALASAELLASAVVRALAIGDTSAEQFRGYVAGQARIVGVARLLQRFIDKVLRHPRLATAAIRRLAERPAAASALLAATGDLRPATSLLSPATVLSFAGPRWMGRAS